MSRGYQIEWVSVRSSVQHGDRLDLEVGLLAILPDDQMRALLREELEREGWRRAADGSLEADVEGTPVTLSPDGKTVSATKSVDASVGARGVDKQSADKELARAAETAKGQLGEKVTKALAKVEAAVKPIVDAAVQRVYLEALKRKAASLGQLESVVETRGEGGELEVTIKVRT